MPLSVVCVYSVEDCLSPSQPIDSGYVIPFGIATIATVLKHAGHRVAALVLTPQTPMAEVLEDCCRRWQPRLFCLTAVTTQFPFMRGVAEAIKRAAPGAYVVLGGHHASLAPDEALAASGVDAICVGEGEAAVLELAACLAAGKPPAGIRNLWIKKEGGAIDKNPPRPFQGDLDALPVIDRDLWRPWMYEPDKEPAVSVGRGCPHRCTYCANHAWRRLAPGQYVRFRAPEKVLAEIAALSQNPRVTQVYLEVETISARLPYALALCRALADFNRRRPTPLEFKINLAVTAQLLQNDAGLDELLAAFREANIVTINIGLESGSEKIRNTILRRPAYTNRQIIAFCRKAREAGLKINLYLMVGLPGETLADFRQTVEVARACEPHVIMASIFYPYPGTAIFDWAWARNYFCPQTLGFSRERRRAYLDLPGFPRHRLMVEYVLLYFRVFHGRRHFLFIAWETFWTFLSVCPKIKQLYLFVTRKTRLGAFLRRRGRLPLARHKAGF